MKGRRVLVAASVAVAVASAGLGIWNSSWLKLETVQ
ncbi:MAG: hypothetical protein QOJ93_1339, partial [Actinomycetota bacterium]|nr:hypothetical protein [Actinomycetota bacterium]